MKTFKVEKPLDPKEVPLREVRKQMRQEIDSIKWSHAERDGVVRDGSAKYEIACFQRALELLPKRA